MLIKPKDMTFQTNYVYFSVNIIIIDDYIVDIITIMSYIYFKMY